ncbi:MAG: HPP family protein [Fervidobacterium sp.]
MENLKVSDVMTYDLTFVFENETVEQVIDILEKSSLSGIPVVDTDLKIVGFISEEDIIRACLPSYFNMLQTAAFLPDTNLVLTNLKKISKDHIGKYATKPVITVKPSDSILYVVDLFMRKNFKIIPVVDENNILLGVVTRISVLKDAIQKLSVVKE